MRIPTLGKNRFYFILNEIEEWYKYALKQNNEVMRLSMEEMLTALIKWENAEKYIKEWEKEIQIQKYKKALGGQNEYEK